MDNHQPGESPNQPSHEGTPRTDAACVSREYIEREMDRYSHKFVLADFARQLERELAEVKALYEAGCRTWNPAFAMVAERAEKAERQLAECAKRELYQLMSDISEDCYCAGWMSGNEFRLWDAITDPNGDRHYGMGEIEPEQIERLRELSEQSGGWWVWEDDAAFIALDEWKRRLAAIRKPTTP